MTVKPIPDGYHTVTPWIISRDTAGLIDYLKEAFDAEEIARVVGDDGRIGHAEVRIGDSIVMPFDAPPHWPPTPAFLRLYVEDADAAHRRAVAVGGTSVTEVTHLFFGDRVGRVRDPLGNLRGGAGCRGLPRGTGPPRHPSGVLRQGPRSARA
ncbi:VOC family protein [Streptomyces sp. 4N124]|uniref:VOC family protein n=1 Tax=Streptomyces sp. 4N124 TaxID=3457420 RepID=UPI003FD358D3